MIKDLQSIFDAITPENIKDVPLIKDAMAIFIDTLEELSKESIEIRNIFQNAFIKEELFKTYLNDLFMVFKRLENNQKILDTIDILNNNYKQQTGTDEDVVSRDIVYNISKYVTEEHFLTFKSFKETKGTVLAIEYIYELINSLFNNQLSDIKFELREEGPFRIDMTGPLPRDFYDYIVHPLAHPLGFVYTYDRAIKFLLEDYFSLVEIGVSFAELKVVCFNLETGEISEDIYIDEQNPRNVVDYKEYSINDIRYREYYFDDGTYLKQTTNTDNSSSVVYLDENDNTIKSYGGQCSISEIGKTIDVELSTDDDEYDLQKKINIEYFARLNPLHNNLPPYEQGLNDLLDADGNYGGTRQEHFYAPSFEAQLKYLEGKYEQNVEVEVNGVTYTQPILYTDVVDDNLKIIDWAPSTEAFERQNIGNEDHIARELLIEDTKILMFSHEVYKEVVNGYTENYIDANGVDRGGFGSYAGYVGSDSGNFYPDGVVGDQYMIGGIFQENDWDDDNLINGYTHTLESAVILDTVVNADPVNLQYNTKDVLNTSTNTSVTDLYELIEEEPLSFITDNTSDIFEAVENKESVVRINVGAYQSVSVYPVFDSIGGAEPYIIGSGYIQYDPNVEVSGNAEVYSQFDDNADSDFDFGVYRNGVLLSDNNVSSYQ
jgi:hypothetical protein